MFKYGRMQKEIPFWLVCGSHSACLECMSLGVQVSAGLELFRLHSSHLVTPSYNRLGLLNRSQVLESIATKGVVFVNGRNSARPQTNYITFIPLIHIGIKWKERQERRFELEAPKT